MTMKKVCGFTLFLLVVLALFSCKKRVTIIQEPETGTFQMRYVYYEYFEPTGAWIRDRNNDGNNVYIGLTGDYYIDEKDTTGRFKALAEEYGEKGTKTFWRIGPGTSKPYNITGVHLYAGTGEKRKDVSDEHLITFEDASAYIASNYDNSKECRMTKPKKISALTEHDLKWMAHIRIFFSQKPTERLTLVFSVKDHPDVEIVVWW